MKVELIMHRYKSPMKFFFDSVEEAAKSAIGQCEEDLAFPHSISMDGKIIWEMEDYLTVLKELKDLIKHIKEAERKS